MTNDEPQTFTGLELEARHVPEEHDPNRPYPHDTNDPITGYVDIGTVIDGVFVVLLRRKAPGLFADIRRAQDARQQQQQQRESQQNEAQRQREQSYQQQQQPPSE